MLSMILVIATFSLSGCGNDTKVPDDGTDGKTAQDYTVQLFFANEEYVNTGNDSLEKFMPVFESKLTVEPDNVYFQTLEALRSVPEEGYSTLVTEEIKFNDVYFEDGTVYVDFDSIGLNGGSLSEVFLISQIVETLVNSFEEVKQVQFLVDGETVESIMGHFDATKPFTKGLF